MKSLNAMEPEKNLESILHYLTKEKGIRLSAICERIALERYEFNNIRRLNNRSRKEKLVRQIISAFQDYFEVNRIVDLLYPEDAIVTGYVRLLEAEVSRLKLENEQFKSAFQ
jgi:molybdopterin-guanine dinucleotide biosynthesis protein A